MTRPPKVLPILRELCATVDRLFIAEVGPFGEFVAAEVREKWVAGGNRIRTSDVLQYIALLAREIPEPDKRAAFVASTRSLAGLH